MRYISPSPIVNRPSCLYSFGWPIELALDKMEEVIAYRYGIVAVSYYSHLCEKDF